MGWITLEELRKHSLSKSFDNAYYKKLERLIRTLYEQKIIEDLQKETHIFYPKYLWQEDERDLELFYFTSEKIVQITTEDVENNVEIKVITKYIRDIKNTKLNLLSYSYDVKLTITFNDESDMVLNSNSDTNDAWKYKFHKEILNIHKLVS